MGWCSATELFDTVVAGIKGDGRLSKSGVIKQLAEALEYNDWDCQQDSAYWDDPLVRKAFRELHPDWFKDEENASE